MADTSAPTPQVDEKTKVDPALLNHLAAYLAKEYARRKTDRTSLEKIWKEIDRQIAMKPDLSRKKGRNGEIDPAKAWLPEVELPLQAQTLEVLAADTKRGVFPNSGAWFQAKSAMTDAYLERAEFSTVIAGDENDVPSRITQDNADKIVVGLFQHWHKMYDFNGAVLSSLAETLRYGTAVGRVRLVDLRSFKHAQNGVFKDAKKIPAFVPWSIWDVYLDDRPSILAKEGHHIQPMTIFRESRSLAGLKAAARDGGTDPSAEGGGWVAEGLSKLTAGINGAVETIEAEGDLLFPGPDGKITHVPNVSVHMALGDKEGERAVYRVEYHTKSPESSLLVFKYFEDKVGVVYSTSPLTKGYPIQVAAVDALTRTMEAAALRNDPPLNYDPDDPGFAGRAPTVYPGATWPSTAGVKPEIVGDPAVMSAIYKDLLAQYYDVTGVNAPRLGAQTVSHTTAFAKEAELARGTIRTVDFVKDVLEGPLTRYLNLAYALGRSQVNNETYYLDRYGGFVTISKKHLPDIVMFEAYGAGAPAEERAKQDRKFAAMQQAVSLEQLRAQAGQIGVETYINFKGAIDEVLTEGGWTDLDAITNRETDSGGESTPLPMAGGPGGAGVVGQGATTAPATAIQTLYDQ